MLQKLLTMIRGNGLNYGATGTGGILGVDEVVDGASGLLTDGQTLDEWKLLGRGILLIIFGFMAWRQNTAAQTVSPQGEETGTT